VTTESRSSRVQARLLAALFLLLAFGAVSLGTPGRAYAQSRDREPLKQYALIFGTVWDRNNRPVYGVRIKVRRSDEKKARWERVSDHSGEFAVRVPPGKAEYVVWADIKTRKGSPKPQETVKIENEERIDIGLHLTE